VDVTALKPQAEHTGNALAPASGTPVDFTSPVSYKVTGAGAEAIYTVEVKRGPVSLHRGREKRDIRTSDGKKSRSNPNGPVLPRKRGTHFLLGPGADGGFYSASGRAWSL
jgi:hypothetical protein